MRIHPVPKELQPWPHRYPRHNTGPGIEKSCHRYLEQHAEEIRSDAIYLPIYWTNCYYAQQRLRMENGFRAVQAAQRVLDALDPNERYVTVCQNCEGIYETMRAPMKVLGCGGTGDVALPLPCAPHPLKECPKDLLASFCGAVQCGGPGGPESVPWRSSYNPEGVGTQIRRAMMATFPASPEFFLEEQRAEGRHSTTSFRALMYRSRYALTPRGYGRTSFRLYEAMQMGCVPVYLSDDPWVPYTDVLDWWEFCVFCKTENLLELPRRLAEIPAEWYQAAVDKLKALVPEFFSLVGLLKQLPRMIEALT